MATPDPSYNPDLPADNSPVSSIELRNQFQGLNALITAAAEGTHESIGGVSALDLTVSDPPTAEEVTQVKDKLNELLAALKS